jgi:phage I-like protein
MVGRMNTTTLPAAAVELHAAGGAAPEWVHLLPAGPEVVGRDGRRFSYHAPAIVAAFVSRGHHLPIDYEHATQNRAPKGEPAPAAGWVVEVQARADGVWGRVEWTEAGRATVAAREYRYTSPVVLALKGTRVATDLISVALTNQPNLHLTSLNRAGAAQEETPMTKAINTALDLAEDASEADAVAAIGKLKSDVTVERNRAEMPDPQTFMPRADYDRVAHRAAELEEKLAAREAADVEAAVDAHVEAGRIAPASKDHYLALCNTAGLDAFEKLAATLPVIGGGGGSAARAAAAVRSEDVATELNAEQRAAADVLGIPHDAYAAELSASQETAR